MNIHSYSRTYKVPLFIYMHEKKESNEGAER